MLSEKTTTRLPQPGISVFKQGMNLVMSLVYDDTIKKN
jgi:hypothetical protein